MNRIFDSDDAGPIGNTVRRMRDPRLKSVLDDALAEIDYQARLRRLGIRGDASKARRDVLRCLEVQGKFGESSRGESESQVTELPEEGAAAWIGITPKLREQMRVMDVSQRMLLRDGLQKARRLEQLECDGRSDDHDRKRRLRESVDDIRGRMSPEPLFVLDYVKQRLNESGRGANSTNLRCDVPEYRFVLAHDYCRLPVEFPVFVNDDFYLGRVLRGSFYDRLIADGDELFDGDYEEVVLGGAIGWGKSTFAEACLCYELYRLSCLRNPALTYGMRDGSSIAFVTISVNAIQARKVLFGGLGTMVRSSPYFQRVFPCDERVRTELRFPHNVCCYPVAANEQSMLGEGVFSAAIDEANFMAIVDRSKRTRRGDPDVYDQMETIYNKLTRRVLSRMNMAGRRPGHIYVISSARYPGDFTERKTKEARTPEGKHIFVRHYPAWGTKPKSVYLGNSFKVEVGDLSRRSRVLNGDETDVRPEQVIEVPKDFERAFRNDTEGCVRDFAGISTLAIKPFIVQREYIQKMFEHGNAARLQHPFTRLDVTLQERDPDMERLLPEHLHWVEKPVLNSLGRPMMKNGQPVTERIIFPALHYAHVDLAKNQCAAGLCVGHAIGTKEVIRLNKETFHDMHEKKPLIRIDLMLRITAPPGKEIDIPRVRALFYQLAAAGMEFGLITFDTYQSQESVKTLKEKGFRSDNFSLDKDYEGYDALKQALYDERIQCYPVPVLERELAQLEDTGKKIDRPAAPGSSKDLADCLAGVVHHVEEGWRNGDALGALFMPGIVDRPGEVRQRTSEELAAAAEKIVEGKELSSSEINTMLFGDLDKLGRV